MNETENKHSVCAANCPLNRVITVHDIGFANRGYDDPEAIEYYSTPLYFCRRKPTARHIVAHSIQEIASFNIPTLDIKKVKKPGWRGFLGLCEVKWTKTGEVTGGLLEFVNGDTLCVSETLEELKSLIEGGKIEETK